MTRTCLSRSVRRSCPNGSESPSWLGRCGPPATGAHPAAVQIRTIRSRTYICSFPWIFLRLLYHVRPEKSTVFPTSFPETGPQSHFSSVPVIALEMPAPVTTGTEEKITCHSVVDVLQSTSDTRPTSFTDTAPSGARGKRRHLDRCRVGGCVRGKGNAVENGSHEEPRSQPHPFGYLPRHARKKED